MNENVGVCDSTGASSVPLIGWCCSGGGGGSGMHNAIVKKCVFLKVSYTLELAITSMTPTANSL